MLWHACSTARQQQLTLQPWASLGFSSSNSGLGTDFFKVRSSAKSIWCAGEPKLVCCKCEHEWCSSCKVPWHGGKSCEQVKQEASAAPADAAFDQYMEKTQTLRCPTCSRALQKSEGCNRIR